MKKYKYILLLLTLLFAACKDPNIVGSDTKIDRNEVVEYEVVKSGNNIVQTDSLNYRIIETKTEFEDQLKNVSTTEFSSFINSIAKIDLNKNTIIVISEKEISVSALITLDTIYIDSKGVVQVDYRLTRVFGDYAQVNTPSIVILLKNRKYSKINFNKKVVTVGEIPKFDGFTSIASNLETYSTEKWKIVLRSRMELENWASEHRINKIEIFKDVDFEKEMIISVGTNEFQKANTNYEITDIQQRGNRLIVSSKFTMVENNVNINRSANHFVKIKKTDLTISFSPTEINNNVSFGKSFYNQKFRLINQITESKTEGYIKKVTNLADLFLTFNPTNELGPNNVEVDFEFFDLLIIKTQTLEVKAIKYEYELLKKDDFGINTNLFIYPDITNDAGKYDTYVLIKILKTNIPISKNFEVIIK